MTKEELLVELEKRMGPLDDKAQEAVSTAVDLITPAPAPAGGSLPESAFQGENPPFDVAAGLSLDERRQLMQQLTEQNRAWLERTCRELQAGWLMVIDGQVILHGATLDNYPTDEELLNRCQRTGKLPLLFIHDQLLAIEETAAWSSTVYAGDSYPTLSVRFHGDSATVDGVADFDTGAIEVYADWDWLSGQGIIRMTPADQPQSGSHLGAAYSYLTKNVTRGMTSTGGTERQIRRGVVCVRNWASSPFVQINPHRQALIGRGICLRLGPIVELDFSHRWTRVRW